MNDVMLIQSIWSRPTV